MGTRKRTACSSHREGKSKANDIRLRIWDQKKDMAMTWKEPALRTLKFLGTLPQTSHAYSRGKRIIPKPPPNKSHGQSEKTAPIKTQFYRCPAWLKKTNYARKREEESFSSRPTVKLPIADFLKGLLVDDWENITRESQLVPIPHPMPVTRILEDYLEAEREKRPVDSASWDILEETIAGFRQYFNKSLGYLLLYPFERPQWHDILRMIRKADADSEIKTPADAYGAEHMARLLSKMGELIAQTNMDTQSVIRLREEMTKFTNWLIANAQTYFVPKYETPSKEYIEQARTF